MTFDSPSYTIEKKGPTGHGKEAFPWTLLSPAASPATAPSGFLGTQRGRPRCLALKARLDQALEEAHRQGFRHFLCAWPRSRPVFLPGGSGPPAAPPGGHPGGRHPLCRPGRPLVRRRPAPPHDFVGSVRPGDRGTAHLPTPGCMQRRNRYMVDRSSLLIAVYDGIPQGGTLNTLSYAMGKGSAPSFSRWSPPAQ